MAGGFNSCVISPFKFHKQLNILCAFCAFLLSRGETMKIMRKERERRSEQKFLLEISATAVAWPLYAARWEHLGWGPPLVLLQIIMVS